MSRFLIRSLKTNETLPVEGEPVNFAGFEGITFFVHRSIQVWQIKGQHPFKYHVSEASTGFLVGRGDTEKEAIEDVEYVLRCKGYEATKKVIASRVEEYGCLLDGVEYKELP